MAHAKNVLLITSDQQHWITLGINNPDIHTPNLDRLAARGVSFDRAYCPNPTCTPTRASIITGQYPSQHGAWSLGTKLPEDALTVGGVFQQHGVRTALVGKAHFQPLKGTDAYPSLESYPILQDLDFWRDFNQDFYGFEHVELARNHTDEAHVGQHYALWMEEKGFTDWRDCFSRPTGNRESQQHRWNIPEEYHYNTWIAERTNALLRGYVERGERFFLWSSYFDPHPSYLVPEPWDTMYDPATVPLPPLPAAGEHDDSVPEVQEAMKEKPDFSPWKGEQGNHGYGRHYARDRERLAKDVAVYYGMVSCMDKHIGTTLDTLDELGIADDTLVVFTSDHGHYFGQHGLTAKGGFSYDDGIRVPFLVSQPGVVPAGRRSDTLTSLVDLAPTFLSWMGLDVPRVMTGLDVGDSWRDPATVIRDHAIVEFRHQPETVHMKTFIGPRYKLTVYYNRPYGELYDLEADPGEITNLWARPEHAALKSRLLLDALHAEQGKEPMWMPRIAGA